MSLTDKIRQSIHQVAEPVKKFLQVKSAVPQEKVTPDRAFQWCQNFLCGAWSTITVDQMRMDRVIGGLSNYLYCCSLPDEIALLGDEPRKVLLRIYGESHQKHRGTLLIDSVVCTLLSERKLGPHIYGIFPDGRLEQFVEAIALVVSEMREPKVSQKIGRLLGAIHQLDMPLVKEPIWLFHSISRFLGDLPVDVSKFESEDDRKIYQELQSVCHFSEEFENLKKILATVDSPVCFTHNDFQPGNILRLKADPEDFTVIDFEYCSYNYRGFDIGNHFCEFMFDYVSLKDWPCFTFDPTLYPNRTQQVNFLSSYIDAQDHSGTQIDRELLINHLLKEANYFALAANMFWTLWSINMATSTAIKFGYMEYARARLTAYYLIRDKLVGANEIPPRLDEQLFRSDKNPFSQSLVEIEKEQLV